jgi:signal transduction histidine kinase
MLTIDRDGRIIQMNQAAQELLELPSSSKVEPLIWDFYSTPAERESIISDLEDNKLSDSWIERKVRLNLKNRELLVKQYWRSVRSYDVETLGYLCFMADISENLALINRLTEFRDDIGNVLHTYTSTLIMVQQAVTTVIRSLGPNPFAENRLITPEQAATSLSNPVKHLIIATETLFKYLSERSLPDDILCKEFSDLLEVLRNHEQEVPIDLFPTILGDVSVSIIDKCKQIRPHQVPREVIRQVIHDAQEITRLTNIIALLQVNSVVIEMDPQLRALREFVLEDRRSEREKVARGVRGLISQAVSNLQGYARSRRVNFRIRHEREHVVVEVDERSIVRALSNLLHNAIKYSWARHAERDPWVSINTHVNGGKVFIEIENWGVPITRDELQQGLIFQIGYRGRLSSDRGRVGTGIGLTDALRVAQMHGGDVSVRSMPAVFAGNEDDYSQPFVTTVSLSLPVYSVEEITQ